MRRATRPNARGAPSRERAIDQERRMVATTYVVARLHAPEPRDASIRPMNRDRPLPGGRLEYAVLVAVWEGGAISGRELHDRVGVPLGLVYTTTARVLDRLHAKGLVAREKDGKIFRYRASASRSEIDRARVARTLS